MANKIGMRNRVVPDPNGKQCSRCLRMLSRDKRSFDAHPTGKDGLKSVCKQCVYERYRNPMHPRIGEYPATITRARYVTQVINGREYQVYTRVEEPL